MDWDACTSYDWEALDAANERYQYVWQALGDIVNATDYSDDWSSSYNMTNMTNGAYVNWTIVDNFDLEVSRVNNGWEMETIFNDT